MPDSCCFYLNIWLKYSNLLYINNIIQGMLIKSSSDKVVSSDIQIISDEHTLAVSVWLISDPCNAYVKLLCVLSSQF